MVTRQRTFRFTAQSDRERLQTRLASYVAERDLWATSGSNVYVRVMLSDDESHVFVDAGAQELDSAIEVLEFSAADPAVTYALAERLKAPGTLACIQSVIFGGEHITVELNGDLTLFFHFIDAHTEHAQLRRRAVLPLSDASLIAAARWLWNAPNLEKLRILEVAAGEGAP